MSPRSTLPYVHFLLFTGLAVVCIAGFSRPVRAEVVMLEMEQPARWAAPSDEFFAAAGDGNLAGIDKALQEGCFVDATIPRTMVPALAAHFSPHTRAAWLVNEPGTTALMLAVANARTEAAAALIVAKANREARTKSGIRPLDVAAERSDTSMMQLILGVTPESDAARLSIVVELGAQRATLSKDGLPVLVTKVSSGRKEKPTPPGRYVVTQKYTDWRSTLYHNASMPFFLRLSCSPVGLHAGVLPGFPASHGCVRLPAEVARKLFDIVPRGTLVEIR